MTIDTAKRFSSPNGAIEEHLRLVAQDVLTLALDLDAGEVMWEVDGRIVRACNFVPEQFDP